MLLSEFLDLAEKALVDLADEPNVHLSVWKDGFRFKRNNSTIFSHDETGTYDYREWSRPKRVPEPEPVKPIVPLRFSPRYIEFKGRVKFDFMSSTGSEVYHIIDHTRSGPYFKEINEAGDRVFGIEIVSRCGSKSVCIDIEWPHSNTWPFVDPPPEKRLCGSCARLTGVATALDVLVNG